MAIALRPYIWAFVGYTKTCFLPNYGLRYCLILFGGTMARTNRITVVMGEDLKEEVIFYAGVQDRSVSDFIRLVLKDWVEATHEIEMQQGYRDKDGNRVELPE
jgi:hypothetical protein